MPRIHPEALVLLGEVLGDLHRQKLERATVASPSIQGRFFISLEPKAHD